MAVGEVRVLDIEIRIEWRGQMHTPMALIDMLDEKSKAISQLNERVRDLQAELTLAKEAAQDAEDKLKDFEANEAQRYWDEKAKDMELELYDFESGLGVRP